jgi:hypothetical protein
VIALLNRGSLKNFPAMRAGIVREQGCEGDAIEVWFADEARVGQKNGITRRWARRGTRPLAPLDLYLQRCLSAGGQGGGAGAALLQYRSDEPAPG